MAKPADFETNVFINCPFDKTYTPILEAIVFTVLACGYTPCSALQERDAADIRLEKIKRLINASQFGIHDISRTEPDVGSGLPRFNMPFELGLDIGARHYGTKQLKEKKILIFDRERYRYQQYLSDIAGQDISAHSDSYLSVINKVRAWLNGSRPKNSSPLIGPKKITNLYEQFKKDLPAICAKASLDHADLDFNDLLYFSGEWIVSSA